MLLRYSSFVSFFPLCLGLRFWRMSEWVCVHHCDSVDKNWDTEKERRRERESERRTDTRTKGPAEKGENRHFKVQRQMILFCEVT